VSAAITYYPYAYLHAQADADAVMGRWAREQHSVLYTEPA
jgi:hypothetical protein